MKRDILCFVSECLTYHQVKDEHQRPAEKLRPLPISEWKWENIIMDFVTGIPRTTGGYDVIWGCWEPKLPLVEFTYNNSYQKSIGMAPHEAFYGRKYRSPVYWDDVGEREELGPDIVSQTAELVVNIRNKMKTTQSRQKSYAD
ncbi:uncharacterized protein [Primulina huaijiensis]|uniref:uncharacterized protein n=1 Tax=Primulina huaijiensis TaxID=1492673 RepID=UPI003CC6E35F